MQPSADACTSATTSARSCSGELQGATTPSSASSTCTRSRCRRTRPSCARTTRRTAAQYIAAGIDPANSTLFVQSHVAAHPQLAWVLNTITGFGEAGRMTQFKDKSARSRARTRPPSACSPTRCSWRRTSCCTTPSVVPVGDDQRQHVELTRDLAGRFNSRFGETFVVPEAVILKETARIYDLQDPTSKMASPRHPRSGVVWLLDEPSVSAKKIMLRRDRRRAGRCASTAARSPASRTC